MAWSSAASDARLLHDAIRPDDETSSPRVDAHASFRPTSCERFASSKPRPRASRGPRLDVMDSKAR
jgi:hypothetical protein